MGAQISAIATTVKGMKFSLSDGNRVDNPPASHQIFPIFGSGTQLMTFMKYHKKA